MKGPTGLRRDPRPDPSSPLEPLRLEPLQRQFREVASRTPGAIALVHGSGTWTYGDLASTSGRLGGLLAAGGVRRGDVVAIVTDRNPALVCGVLATLEAGAAFVIIDDAYPDARVAAYLEQARPRHVLLAGAARRRESAMPRDIPVTCLPDTATETGVLVGAFEPPQPWVLTPDDLAYLLFTSGSTGTPKCVATGHAPLTHFVAWHSAEFGLGSTDRFSLLSGLSHDPVLRDVFTPLSIGATLHIPAQAVLTDPAPLVAWMREQEITVAHLTPPLGQVLLAGAADQQLPRLRWLFWGGDVLRPAFVKAFAPVAPGARHVNFYGTTETPQAVGYQRVDDPDRWERIPLGRGIDDVQLLVLDDTGNLAPVHEVGELVVRSRYLSQGYWPNAAASGGKYVTNPSGTDPGDRLYHTGDLALYLPDGAVEFRGRSDDQVKVRGYRIELGEVATALRHVPEAADVIVLGRADPAGETQIVAYAAAAPGRVVTTDALAECARQELPRYMHPSAYMVLPELPRLPNGKIDRRALLDLPLPATVPDGEAPRTEREMALARVWSDVLGVPGVARNESFYDLGGDSLTAIRVMLRMRSLGLDEATCRGILQGRTIAEIAAGGTLSEARDRMERRPGEHSRLVLSTLRGLMVVLVVSAHWLNTIFRRWPGLLPSNRLNPLLNWPTPGFAIAFGMTLGFVYYPAHKQNPYRARIMLWRGALLVGAGAVVFALDQMVFKSLGHGGLPPLATVLLYYTLALLSAPVWLRLLGSERDVAKRAMALGLAFLAVHHGLRSLPWPQDSWVWQFYALGKFSYFNLSAGAMLGVVLGFTLKRNRRVPGWYLAAGAGLGVIGALLSVDGGRLRLVEESNDIEVWKWLFYAGMVLVTLVVTDSWLRLTAAKLHRLDGVARLVGTVGQLAFPLFILDFASRDLSKICDVIGLPTARLGVGALLFGAGAVWLVAKAHRLYYGSAEVDRAGSGEMVPEA